MRALSDANSSGITDSTDSTDILQQRLQECLRGLTEKDMVIERQIERYRGVFDELYSIASKHERAHKRLEAQNTELREEVLRLRTAASMIAGMQSVAQATPCDGNVETEDLEDLEEDRFRMAGNENLEDENPVVGFTTPRARRRRARSLATTPGQRRQTC